MLLFFNPHKSLIPFSSSFSSLPKYQFSDGVLDGIKDHVLSIDDNFVELFFSSDLYLHMTTVMVCGYNSSCHLCLVVFA